MGPDDDSVAIVAQWCFPLRLQHAGNFESASEANTAGLIREKLKTASSSIADARRMEIIVPKIAAARDLDDAPFARAGRGPRSANQFPFQKSQLCVNSWSIPAAGGL